jgi:hypothetical protein
MEQESQCVCREWAYKVTRVATWPQNVATTFTCPVHGQVTIDTRSIPRPSVGPDYPEQPLSGIPRPRYPRPGPPRRPMPTQSGRT